MTQDLSLYRPNVGVVLFHPDGRVWLGRRVATPGPHNWQFPQGGIDPGEDLETAAQAMRERDERAESIFRQSVDAEKNKADLLEKKFAEALRKAKDAPEGKPLREFDLD